MNKAEIIKGVDINALIEGIYAIESGLRIIRDTLSAVAGKNENAEPVPEEEAPALLEVAKEAPAAKETTEVSTSKTAGNTYSRTELEKMPYNKFKTLAASLGVKCTGTRDDIMGRIEKLGVVTDSGKTTSEPEVPGVSEKKGRMTKKATPAVEEAPAEKSNKSVGSKRGLVKKASEPAPDEFDEQAKSILEDTEVSEVISALAEVNVKATKRNVAEKLAYALREGLIEPDDEEEDSEEEDTTEDEAPETVADDGDEDVEDSDDGSYHSEYDPEGFNAPANMTKDRREAVESLVDKIQTDFSEGSLNTTQMTDFLTSVCTQEELDLLEDPDDEDALLAFYIEIQKRFIDDEGDTHSLEDPYEMCGKDMCCGHQLKYVSKTKRYVCETCGAEYEAAE